MTQLRKCDECRKRKVKCDERRPQCSSCAKKNRLCNYKYQDDLIFMESQTQISRNTHLSISSKNPLARRPAEASNIALSIPSSPSYYSEAESEKSSDVNRISSGQQIAPQHSLTTLHSAPINRQQLLSSFVENYIQDSPGNDYKFETGLSWIRRLPESLGQHDLLDSALSALSLVYLGKLHHDEVLLHKSVEHYDSVLQSIQPRVSQPSNAERKLEICVLLSIYELHHPTYPDVRGWVFHVRGACEILKQMGPPSNDRPLDLNLYRRIRTAALFDSLGSGKASFFTMSEWQNTSDAPFDQLLDILFCILAITTEVDQIKSNAMLGQITPSTIDTLMEKCQILQARLIHWYLDLQGKIPGPIYHVQPISVDMDQYGASNISPGRTFQEEIIFPNFSIRETMLLYWVGELVNHDTMINLVTSGQSLGISANGESDNVEPIQALEAAGDSSATKICQATFCYSRAPPQGYAIQSALVPMWVAMRHFNQRSAPEYELCHEILMHMRNSGFNIAEPLRHLTRRHYLSIEDDW
ncbi:hypothetical protein F5884DRAFT_246183 [Xylogone sp. PMI_703]|nr:hypothetical protein F5884DRAFT_246183 [Xylogone sp. PMI_703]